MFYYEPIKLTIPLDFFNFFLRRVCNLLNLKRFSFSLFFFKYFFDTCTLNSNMTLSPRAKNLWLQIVGISRYCPATIRLACHSGDNASFHSPSSSTVVLVFWRETDTRATGPRINHFGGEITERERERKKPSQRRRHIGRRRQGQPGCRGR